MIITDLIIPAILLIIGILIWKHLGVSQTAYKVAHKRALKEGFTILDQTIVLASMRIVKSKHSLFAVQRKYHFEFSTVGDMRYKGELVFEGERLQSTKLEAYKVGSNEPV